MWIATPDSTEIVRCPNVMSAPKESILPRELRNAKSVKRVKLLIIRMIVNHARVADSGAKLGKRATIVKKGVTRTLTVNRHANPVRRVNAVGTSSSASPAPRVSSPTPVQPTARRAPRAGPRTEGPQSASTARLAGQGTQQWQSKDSTSSACPAVPGRSRGMT